MSTEKTELLSPDTCSTVTTEDTKLELELDELVAPAPFIPPRNVRSDAACKKETAFTNANVAAGAADDDKLGCETEKLLQSEQRPSGIPSASSGAAARAACSDDDSNEKSKSKCADRERDASKTEVVLDANQLAEQQQHSVTRYVNV